jgi:hypothetical protein
MCNELLNAILYLGSTLLHTIGGGQLIKKLIDCVKIKLHMNQNIE